SGGESVYAGGRDGYQADADRADRGGLPEEKISRVCGYRIEPGRCDGMCARTCGGAGKRKERTALHPGRRESDVEADSRQTGGDYGIDVAACEGAVFYGAGDRRGGRGCERKDWGRGAASDDRRRTDGTQEDVCFVGEGGTGTGLDDCAGGRRVAAR